MDVHLIGFHNAAQALRERLYIGKGKLFIFVIEHNNLSKIKIYANVCVAVCKY